MLDIEASIKVLQEIENNENMDQTQFSQAHKKVQEIMPKLKALIETLDKDQKLRFDKKAEQKVTKAQLEHHNKL